MMPPSATFAYYGVVPAAGADGSFECSLASRDRDSPPASLFSRVASGRDPLTSTRLVGWSPRLVVHGAGLTPDAGPDRPLVARHALTMQSSRFDRGPARSATFHVESTLIQCLEAGDVLHLVRTGGGDLGLSVIRDGLLAVAVGAVERVPLGRDLSVATPWDLVEEIEALYRRRDPEFAPGGLVASRFRCPLEVRHGTGVALVLDRPREVGPFEVGLLRGATRETIASAAAGSICRIGMASRLGATLTAQLMAAPDALEMLR